MSDAFLESHPGSRVSSRLNNLDINKSSKNSSYRSRSNFEKYGSYTRRRQSGAILPIAIFFFLILSAGLFVIYNTAQVTSTKRQLTNAADAIAFSNATITAEGLNYTAYTNRAIMANYQATGQVLGMWSGLSMSHQMTKNTATLIGAVGQLINYVPELEEIGTTITTIGKVYGGWGTVMKGVRYFGQAFANISAFTNSLSNYTLFAAQQVHLITTVSTLIKMNEAGQLLAANTPKGQHYSYIPGAIVYQVGKSISDLYSMLKWNKPQKAFMGNLKTEPGQKMPNLVHQLLAFDLPLSNIPLAGRRLLPNAAGLWLFDGCGIGNHTGAILGAAAGDNNGLGKMIPALGGSAAGSTISALLDLAGAITTPFFQAVMCPFLGMDRWGGTESFENQDGTYAWSNFDTIGDKLSPAIFAPFLFTIPGAVLTGLAADDKLRFTLAGSVNISKQGQDMRTGGTHGLGDSQTPSDLTDFIHDVVLPTGGPAGTVKGDGTIVPDPLQAKSAMWGSSSAVDDCLYFTLPNGGIYEPRSGIAIGNLVSGGSNTAQGSGACLSLTAGNARAYYQRGIFNDKHVNNDGSTDKNNSYDTANDSMKHGNAGDQQTIQNFFKNLLSGITGAAATAATSFENASSDASLDNSPDNDTNAASTGVRGGTPSGLPGTDASTNATVLPGSAAEAVQALEAQAGRFNFGTANLEGFSMGGAVTSIMNQAIGFTSLPDGGTNNSTGDKIIRDLLKIVGLDKVFDLLTMQPSVGVESLYQEKGKKGFLAADMGIPFERFGLWDVRGAKDGNYDSGDSKTAKSADNTMFTEDIKMQQAELADMGPSFLIAVEENINSLPTSNNSAKRFSPDKPAGTVDPAHDISLYMPDYPDGKVNNIKGVGKARVYYRSPSERWTIRGQLVTHANLMLPYWNARLEGLNYPEKLLFSITNFN